MTAVNQFQMKIQKAKVTFVCLRIVSTFPSFALVFDVNINILKITLKSKSEQLEVDRGSKWNAAYTALQTYYMMDCYKKFPQKALI